LYFGCRCAKEAYVDIGWNLARQKSWFVV